MIYAETGRWPLSKQDDIDRNYIRNHPETMLSNIEDQRELFDVEEFKALVKKPSLQNSNQLNLMLLVQLIII